MKGKKNKVIVWVDEGLCFEIPFKITYKNLSYIVKIKTESGLIDLDEALNLILSNVAFENKI